MKVLCINNKYLIIKNIKTYVTEEYTNKLTINKYYQVTDIDDIGFRIIDDNNNNYWYTKELFQSPEDNREEKLNTILK